jgi:hypothetical protein
LRAEVLKLIKKSHKKAWYERNFCFL